jgi:hypothetical protein
VVVLVISLIEVGLMLCSRERRCLGRCVSNRMEVMQRIVGLVGLRLMLKTLSDSTS